MKAHWKKAFRSTGVVWTLAVSAASAHSADSHQVAGRFEPTTSATSLRFVFEVRPNPRLRPVVRRLGATPRHDSVTLDVQTEPWGRYVVLLANLSPPEEARLQIEVRDDPDGWFELHQAHFALRPLVPDRVVAASSFDGNLVVHNATAPAALTVVIATTELPLDGLPASVSASDVLAAYTVDLLPPTPAKSGWVLSVGTRAEASSLFYRSRATRRWEAREAVHVSGHAVLTTSMPGPGTWLLVRGGLR